MKTKTITILTGLLFVAYIATAQQPQQPGGRPPGPPKPPAEHSKEVAAKLEKDLTLTKEQSEKVSAAYLQFFAAMDKVHAKMGPPPPPPPMPPAAKKAADSLTVIRDEAIKKTLTAAQFARYKEVEKTMRPQHPPGPPPPPQPPKQ